MHIDKEILSLVFPKDTFKYFDLTEGYADEDTTYFTLTEKNEPPTDKKVIAKKFHNITISDFPIRGKYTQLTFRRRYWQIKGQKDYLKRDIQLAFPGTQLEKEFGDFLKEGSRKGTTVLDYYSKNVLPPTERI